MNEKAASLARWAASEVGETIRFFAGVAAVWFVLVTFGFAAFHIPSESMQPTLQVGDRVLVSKWAYGYSRHSLPLGIGYHLPDSWSGRVLGSTPKPGDVVVVRDPDQRINLIKRVVGQPGDVIAVEAGVLHVNGEPVTREWEGVVRYRDRSGLIVQASEYVETLPNGVSHPIYERSDQEELDDVGPFRVPAGHLFLMGDNRDASADSRVNYTNINGRTFGLGYVHLDEVVGRAETVLFTFASCRREEGLICPEGRVWRPL